ncbi:MAG: hypothetical protein Q9201_006386 [Fulgogasparrea decipioides]
MKDSLEKKEGPLTKLRHSIFGGRRRRESIDAERTAGSGDPWVYVGHPGWNNIQGFFDGPVGSMTHEQAAGSEPEWTIPPPWERTGRRDLALETLIYEEFANNEYMRADAEKLTMDEREYCYYMMMEHGSARTHGRRSRLDELLDSPEGQARLNEVSTHRGTQHAGLDDAWGWYRPSIIPQRQNLGFNYYVADNYHQDAVHGWGKHFRGNQRGRTYF